MATTEIDPSQEEDYEDESSSSETGGVSDDSDQDPTFDVVEETRVKLSDMSIKKSRPRVSKEKGPGSEERVELESAEVEIPELDEKDGKCFEIVEKLIGDGQLEKLKIDQCKVYLRKYGLRLTGKKDILISRIREHLEVKDGGGEKKYPLSSFVLNCKGDSCTGDVVMFEQKVYEGYSIASRSATGPSCGTRTVAGRIVKESYGEAKQQHTFTIEVLWSKGEKPLPPLHPLLIKGRNLYRLMTKRQRWADEEERRRVLQEKHTRGFHARSSRETRVKQKEMRQMGGTKRTKENKSNHVQAKQKCHQKDPIENQTGVILQHIQSSATDTNIPKAPNPYISQFRPRVNISQVLKPQNHEYKAPQPSILGHYPQTSSLGHYPQPQPQPQPHSGWIRPAISLQDAHRYHQYNYHQPRAQRQPLSTNFHVPNAPANFHEQHQNAGMRAHHFYQQRQQCPYYRQGRCFHAENCKYLHD